MSKSASVAYPAHSIASSEPAPFEIHSCNEGCSSIHWTIGSIEEARAMALERARASAPDKVLYRVFACHGPNNNLRQFVTSYLVENGTVTERPDVTFPAGWKL